MATKSLIDLARESGDIASLSMLDSKTEAEQLDEVGALMVLALGQGNDEAMKKFASWLLYGTSPEVQERVTKERSQRAIAIWGLMQGYKIKRREDLKKEYEKRSPEAGDRFEHYLHDHPIQAFPNTRLLLLTDIVYRWRYTSDGAESDEIFQDFLLHEFFTASPTKEEQDLMRKVTDYFSTDRLMRQIVLARSTIKELCGGEEVIRTLFFAWARRVRISDITQKFAVIEPLADCSDEAHGFMELQSKKMAKLDREVKYLLWVLGSTFKGKQPENSSEYDSLYGCECTISYQSLGLVEVCVEMAAVKSTFKETEGHELFEKARANIKLWQETHEYGVYLRVFIKDKYNKEVIFSRLEELLIKY